MIENTDLGNETRMNLDPRRMSSLRLERFLAVVAFGIIAVAWAIGSFRAESDLRLYLKLTLPAASRFDFIGSRMYRAWGGQTDESLMGYVTTAKAHGYGGEMEVAVAVSPAGEILGLAIVEQKETPAFFQRVLRSGLLDSLRGKTYSDTFTLGTDVDGVTGATYSSRAIVDATRKATRRVAARELGLYPPGEPSPEIRFGFPEVVLVALFGFGIVGRLRRFKYKKTARWASMWVGLGVLGFGYNRPLTIVWINRLLLGYWPPWQTNLYWIILLGGIFFIHSIDKRNPYCEWFCPFGATQECLSVVGGARIRVPLQAHSLLRWGQRFLALAAIAIALILRNPGVSSYEVFGAFFRLIGSNFTFALLGIVLVASLFIRRPWCSYLCPIRPVTDIVRLIRHWVVELGRTSLSRRQIRNV